NVREAQRTLADEIQSVERTNPDALVIVLEDFNKGNLSHELPKYKQFIKCPTREGNVLDHCYTTISGAYRAVPHAALGQSNHIMVHLIPAYRQKLKLCKPVVRTSKKWTSDAVGELQGCLDCTDWDVFRSTTNSLDEYTDTVSSYIYFCEDSIIKTCTRVSYNNANPWFTAKLRSEKEAAFRSGDKGKYKEAKYRISEEVRRAKTEHGERMKQQFQTNDSASVWKGLKAITSSSSSSYTFIPVSPTQLHTLATGPDSVSHSLLKHCANQLSPVIFKYLTGDLPCASLLQDLSHSSGFPRILRQDTVCGLSSDFNSIVPALLRDKLFQLNVSDSVCSWITDFLTDRRQFVRLGTHVSDLQHISTGSPQGYVLSPLLFSLYTNGCTSGLQSVKFLKFADDTTLIGLISDGDESAYRGEMDRLVSWCSMNNLELNSLKTVEMIVDFRKDPAPRPPSSSVTLW
ncbi:hypothetical protein QTP86_017851, partial [Hemibagrus guttatus]